jgi:hypothetical protein
LAQWEQFRKRRNKEEERKTERKGLTLTGLLMEGPEPKKSASKGIAVASDSNQAAEH